ncbi:MAG TPA: hypothetical protein VFL41_05255 [Gaiellaceae bacterium]|nr:hypothetical protein [Gaiellaceae bacterium]
MKTLALVGVIALLTSLAATAPAGARFQEPPVVDIQSVAGMSPDGGTIGVTVLASCPERWTVVEATVTVSQPSGSGQASFPLTCIQSIRPFSIAVPATTGSFQLGDAQVSATVVIKRGKTARADDSEVLRVDPTVLVELASSGQRVDDGGAVVLDVTVACPAGTTGRQSSLVVSQSPVIIGSGTYTPICDGLGHTFTVRVEADSNPYQPGIAQALTFAQIEWQGEIFYGIDDDGALELVG